MTSQLPLLNDKYQLERRIGSGGFGEVYQARDLQLDRRVAVKLINPGLTHSVDYAERFVREAKLTSQLRHPHTLTVYDFGQHEERLFLVSELLYGETLKQRILRCGRIDPSSMIKLLLPVCDALREAHELGVIHRDLKPDNLFLHRERHSSESASHVESERLILLDFGIAKSIGELHQTQTGQVFGTPHYMSPEQIRAPKSVDARADLYSLGVILFEALVGELPYQADSLFEVFELHVRAPIPSITGHSVDGLEPLDGLISALLQKDPDQRLSSAVEVASALRALRDEGGYDTPPLTLPPLPSSLEHSESVSSSLVETVDASLIDTGSLHVETLDSETLDAEMIDAETVVSRDTSETEGSTSTSEAPTLFTPEVTANTFSLGHVNHFFSRYGATFAIFLLLCWGGVQSYQDSMMTKGEISEAGNPGDSRAQASHPDQGASSGESEHDADSDAEGGETTFVAPKEGAQVNSSGSTSAHTHVQRSDSDGEGAKTVEETDSVHDIDDDSSKVSVPSPKPAPEPAPQTGSKGGSKTGAKRLEGVSIDDTTSKGEVGHTADFLIGDSRQSGGLGLRGKGLGAGNNGSGSGRRYPKQGQKRSSPSSRKKRSSTSSTLKTQPPLEYRISPAKTGINMPLSLEVRVRPQHSPRSQVMSRAINIKLSAYGSVSRLANRVIKGEWVKVAELSWTKKGREWVKVCFQKICRKLGVEINER